MKRTDKTGDLVGAQMVRPDQTVMLMSSSGQVIRMPAEQISLIGRATQGVTVMKPKRNEVVVSVDDQRSRDRPSRRKRFAERQGDQLDDASRCALAPRLPVGGAQRRNHTEKSARITTNITAAASIRM